MTAPELRLEPMAVLAEVVSARLRYFQWALPVGVLRALDRATLMLAGFRLGHHLCLVARRSAADSPGVAGPRRAP